MLETLDDAWRKDREHIGRAGGEVGRELARRQDEAMAHPAEPSDPQVEAIVAGIRDAYDCVHGGFGTAPKFFTTPAVRVLLARAFAGDKAAADMAAHTLDAIARGGVYDQVSGGFHRYSVDERWHVPHFEKMAYDNAALLALYADAYALTGRDDFRRVAAQTREWIDRVLRDPHTPGFFASQDADVGLHDDGDYFTWTSAELRAAVGDDADVAVSFFAVDDVGDVHGRPGRNVLHTPKTLPQEAELLGKAPQDLAAAIDRARRKLLDARRKRPAPRVDKTVLADLNGMMIDAYLTAWERLGDESARRTALETLDALLADLRDSSGVFAHFRQGGGEAPGLWGVGLLADQAWMARALLHAAVATGEARYLQAAAKLADYVLSDLTGQDGAFLDAPAPPTPEPWDLAPTRGWEDSPTRSAASVAAQALLDLAYLTGRDDYAAAARKALAAFAGAPGRDWGTFLAGYAMALDQLLHGPRTVVVAGPGGQEETKALLESARRAYVPGGMVLSLDPAVEHQADLLKRLGYPPAQRPVAYVCAGKACLAPAYTPQELQQRLSGLDRNV